MAGLAVVFVLAAALNPSAERHREAVRREFSAQGPLIGALAGQLASMSMQYQTRVFFSYTTLDGKVASWGALGFVHAMALEDEAQAPGR